MQGTVLISDEINNRKCHFWMNEWNPCDLEKDFDFVNHDTLISRLEICAITAIDKELFWLYHKGRYQTDLLYSKTHHSSTLSNWTLIGHKVPQDSILGLLLFLLHINNLHQCVNNKSLPILFAYNTNILFTHSKTTELNSNTHTVFKTMNTWFKNNYLSLNFEILTVFTLRLGTVQQLTWRLVIIIN
jgi:hypothetical protein